MDKRRTILSGRRDMALIDKYEAGIIAVFIVSVTVAVITKAIDQSTYAALMGAFVGYTFGRIFNHAQGKE